MSSSIINDSWKLNEKFSNWLQKKMAEKRNGLWKRDIPKNKMSNWAFCGTVTKVTLSVSLVPLGLPSRFQIHSFFILLWCIRYFLINSILHTLKRQFYTSSLLKSLTLFLTYHSQLIILPPISVKSGSNQKSTYILPTIIRPTKQSVYPHTLWLHS